MAWLSSGPRSAMSCHSMSCLVLFNWARSPGAGCHPSTSGGPARHAGNRPARWRPGGCFPSQADAQPTGQAPKPAGPSSHQPTKGPKSLPYPNSHCHFSQSPHQPPQLPIRVTVSASLRLSISSAPRLLPLSSVLSIGLASGLWHHQPFSPHWRILLPIGGCAGGRQRGQHGGAGGQQRQQEVRRIGSGSRTCDAEVHRHRE